ncbi:MAG TPA: sugar transferase [Thermodesulfobacteriota bacterium]|nr:sugar transferase [Thermodesulfobacteriota bacterium]
MFSPLFILIPILIKLDSRGPVFFKQKRCGLGGREFEMYKFRSMVNDAPVMREDLSSEVEGSVFKIKKDPRITRIGRFLRRTSLDELPQFLCILKGDMSLVGPRPLADEEMSADRKWKRMRLTVKPGLTGLWQVKGRATGKFTDWVRYDEEYVEKRSLFLDIKLLLLTIWTVITGRGAY